MLKLKKLLLGLVLSIVFTGILFSVLSLIVLKLGLLPVQLSSTLGLCAAAASVFAGAMITAHAAGERGLLHGLSLAAGYAVLYILFSILCSSGASDTILLLIRCAVFLCSGTVGGILGVGSGKSKVKF